MFKYSVSKFFNYVKKDYIIDWLNLYGSKHGFIKEKRNAFFMNKGNELEKKVKDMLVKDMPTNEFADLTQFIFKNYTHQQQTKTKLQDPSVSCIYQGLVADNSNVLYGITDFIVTKNRLEDWISKYSKSVKSNNDDSATYYVIDVKSSCQVNADGKVCRSTRNYEWLQFQLSMYSSMLSSYGVKTSNKAYIMSFKNDRIVMGEMDVITINKDELLAYMNELHTKGDEWTFSPKPSNDYMYPNMKNEYDDDWRKVKNTIAEKIGEWTLIPYVSVKKRQELWEKGFKTFRESGIVSRLDELKLDNKFVIEVNQQNVFAETRNTDLVKQEIKKIFGESDVVLYIDIETIYHNFSFVPFMACVYCSTYNKYDIIMCDSLEDACRGEISNKVSDIMEKYTESFGKIKVVHYSGNESQAFRKNEKVEYVDLYDILKTKKFAMTGLYSLKLKDLYKSVIRVKEEMNIANGLEAMAIGNLYYASTSSKEKEKYKTDLQKYIKRDVDILVKVIRYFIRLNEHFSIC